MWPLAQVLHSQGMDHAAPTESLMASLLLSAAHGDAEAHRALGQIFADPRCPQQDPVKAKRHFELADFLDQVH